MHILLVMMFISIHYISLNNIALYAHAEPTQSFHGCTKLQLAVYITGEDISSDILHVWQWIIM